MNDLAFFVDWFSHWLIDFFGSFIHSFIRYFLFSSFLYHFAPLVLAFTIYLPCLRWTGPNQDFTRMTIRDGWHIYCTSCKLLLLIDWNCSFIRLFGHCVRQQPCKFSALRQRCSHCLNHCRGLAPSLIHGRDNAWHWRAPRFSWIQKTLYSTQYHMLNK